MHINLIFIQMIKLTCFETYLHIHKLTIHQTIKHVYFKIYLCKFESKLLRTIPFPTSLFYPLSNDALL